MWKSRGDAKVDGARTDVNDWNDYECHLLDFRARSIDASQCRCYLYGPILNHFFSALQLELSWVSLHIDLVTSVGSAHTGFVSAWQRAGVVKY